MSEILSVKNAKKYYGSGENLVKALDDVSFSVREGELMSIMGPSGSGKSTLLNVISTIDKVDSGYIKIGDNELSKIKGKNLARFRSRNLGFIFQELNLLDTMTLYENIQLALSINKCPYKDMESKIIEISKQLGIEKILHKYPYEVSGGQKQRCACARALINNPRIILADEPTGSLDMNSSKKLMQLFEIINKKFNITIVIVTHNPLVASYCNRVLFIKDGKLENELFCDGNQRSVFLKGIQAITSKFEEEFL